VVAGRDFSHAEQGPAIEGLAAFPQGALRGKERRGLHGNRRERQ
jgi:hypothetical protein